MNDAFRHGKVLAASPEELQDWLRVLCHEEDANSAGHPRQIARALTINHLQMAGVIRDLNKANSKKDRLITLLAVASLLGTLGQLAVAMQWITP